MKVVKYMIYKIGNTCLWLLDIFWTLCRSRAALILLVVHFGYNLKFLHLIGLGMKLTPPLHTAYCVNIAAV